MYGFAADVRDNPKLEGTVLSVIRQAVLFSICVLVTHGAATVGLPRLSAADSTDPYIIAQAQALGNDTNRIFAFVRDQIRFEVYRGSVRGARGTLWSKAGNSLDKSSLLIALLGAAGVKAQYVQGSLDPSQYQGLINILFPVRSRVVGCIPQGFGFTDRFSYGGYAADMTDHFWVEFGGGNTPADATIPGSTIGQIFATVVTRFTSIPQNFRQQITVRVKAETFSLAAGIFGFGPSSTIVLEQIFDTAELAGKPISLFHATSSSAPPALGIGAVTNTYTPLLLVGQGDADMTTNPVIKGTDYQELLTNFPLGSTILTGVFLEIDALDANGVKQTYTRTVFDRIGFDVRQNGGSVSLSNPSATNPVFTNADVVTVYATPALQSTDQFALQQTRLTTVQQQLAAIQPQLTPLDNLTTLTPDQVSLVQRGMILGRYNTIAKNELIALSYARAEDVTLAKLQQMYMTRAFFNSPRLLFALTSFQNGVFSSRIDILKNDTRDIIEPGQSTGQGNPRRPGAAYQFEIARGMLESSLEGRILSQITGQPAIAIEQVFAALPDRTKYLIVIQQNVEALEKTTLSATARARITLAAAAGKLIITPYQMVTINGVTTVAWYEHDPATGATISVFEDGGHQALVEYTFADFASGQAKSLQLKMIGYISGHSIAGIAFASGLLQAIAANADFGDALDNTADAVKNNINLTFGEAIKDILTVKKGLDSYLLLLGLKADIPKAIGPGFDILSLLQGLFEGIDAGVKLFQRDLKADPPVVPFLTSDLSPEQPAITPGASPAVGVTLVSDPLFTKDYNLVQLPSVYIARIQNLGPATDTFKIDYSGVANGFSIKSSLTSLPVGAGKTGESGVCVQPTGDLPPPNTPVAFNIDVSSVKDPTIKSTVKTTFVVPAIQAVVVKADPPTAQVTPGTSVAVNIVVQSTGNLAAGNVDLSIALPAGLSASVLTTPVAPAVGQTLTQAVTFTVNASVAPGTELKALVSGTFGPAGARQVNTVEVIIRATATYAKCAQDASDSAARLKRTRLSGVLDSLGLSMIDLGAAPGDAAALTRLLGYIDNLNVQLNSPFLTPYVAGFTAQRAVLAAANASSMFSALNGLSTILCNLNATLQSANTYNFFLGLAPVSVVSTPTAPAVFNVQAYNLSDVRKTYVFGISGLPAGVTAVFSRPKITLDTGVFDGTTSLTISQSSTNLQAFNFTVTATIEDAPSNQRSVIGAVTLRNEFVTVDNVTVTPGIVANPGDSITVNARVFNAVNQTKTVFLIVWIRSVKTGKTVRTGFFGFDADKSVSLDPSTTLVNTTVVTLPTTNYPPGAYVAEVYVGTEGDAEAGTYLSLAKANFSVGAPINGTLTVTPSIVPPGTSVVQGKLAITRDSIVNPVSTLIGASAISGTPRSIALKGSDAYVCADSSISRVDVSNPANPVVKNTFAQGQLTGSGVAGYVAVPCAIIGNNLIVEYSRPNGNTTASVLPTQVAVYDITNPASPALVSNTGFQKPDANGLSIIGNFGFTTTTVLFYNPFSRFIFAERGDLIAFNLTNLNAPTFAGTLFPAPPGDPDRGGYNQIFGHVVANPTTILLSSTTAGGPSGGDYTSGVGNIIVADVSNPASMSIVKQVQIPEARLIGAMAIQGNTAIAVGDSQGYYDALSGLVGNLTITSLDVTDPRNPKVLQTIVTGLTDNTGPSVVALGNNTFAAGGTSNSGKPVLLFIDASNPSQLRYVPYDASVLNTPVLSSGNLFYSIGDTGLSIYRLDSVAGPQLVAVVQIPKGTGVTVDQASFSLAPSQVTPGSTFDTYTWNQPAASTITWNETVTGIVPSVPKQAITGGTITYTLPVLGTGTIPLPPSSVLADQIIGMSPSDLTTTPTIAASYPVTLKNPTSVSRTYNLSVLGVPAAWAQLPAPVTVPALGSTAVTVKITPDASTSSGAVYLFSLAASEASGINGSVFGTLRVSDSINIGSDQGTATIGSVLTVSPSQQQVGLGDSVKYTVHVVNTGNQPVFMGLDAFSNTSSQPYTFSFLPSAFTLQPGLNNGQDVVMTVTASTIATPGVQNFTVRAAYSGAAYTTTASLTILSGGVTVQFNPTGGTPSTPYQLIVRNTGKSSDTFDLTLSGLLAPGSTLGSTSVTLAAGAQQTIPVTLGAVDFALPGNLTLTATATSHSNTVITASTTATVTVPGIKGVTAVFSPGQAQVATAPGSTAVGLSVINTGNASDSFTASITAKTGPVTASLTGTDNNPTQTISAFRLGGLSSGRIPVSVGLSAAGSGSVTVTITSISDPTVKASATVTIGAGGALQPPVANAGSSQSTSIGKTVTLDGSASADPNSPALTLTYLWTLVSKPAASTISSSTIQNAASAKATITPDAAGSYTFQIAVTNSVGSSTATVTTSVGTVTPTAGVSAPQILQIGGTIALDGTTSVDGNSPPLPLTYQWTLVSSPAGSILGAAQLRTAASAKASFIPDVLGIFTFKLTVNNGTQTASANVSTSVIAGPPVAIARVHQNVAVGTLVFLDGGKSFDWLGARLTYLWDFVSQPAGSALTGADIGGRGTPRPSFTPKVNGPYVLRLTVNNGTADSSPSLVTITAFTAGSIPPTANAGVKQNVARGSVVTLDATKSAGSGVLTYVWRFGQTPAGSSIVGGAPASATSTKPTFVPDVAGDFVLTVRVTNASGSDEDSVTISAFDGNVPPNANAGADQFLALGVPANLDGRASRDPDNGPQPLTYSWKLQSAASAQADSAIAQNTTSTPSFTPDKQGYYVVRLQTFDGADRSFDNTVLFASTACDADGNGSIQQQDISLISAAIGTVVGPGDPRDADADGVITDNDVKLCTARIFVASLPSIGAQPERLVFDYQKEFGAPKPQKIVVSADVPLGFRLVTSPSWLIATPAFGSAAPGTNAIINVSVDALGTMPAGYYDGVVVVVAPGAQSNPVVRVRVNLTDPPQLIALPGELNFRFVKGSLGPQSQILYVTASGRPIQFDAAVTSGTWLMVNPNHTQIPMNLSVAVSPDGLPAGDYEGTIALSSPDAQNSPKIVKVKLKVVSP